MKTKFCHSRRKAIKQSLAVAAGVAGLGPAMLASPRLRAQEQERVSEDDPTAVQLKYKHDATASERPSDDQFCHNCTYFKGSADQEWAPCDLFPGKAVAGNGWCNVWTLKR